ncbi:hypothetical protein HPB47_005114 [Ixodes persulcatus]|uniref:Uncharacterized protein n=1 Tax=Ixodes persulcatus TaxID=34615 RepID=A0AC60PEQ2_IXOPE|nr:hypothetical protein HPB47_005114 [Ixodes persulcatus]
MQRPLRYGLGLLCSGLGRPSLSVPQSASPAHFLMALAADDSEKAGMDAVKSGVAVTDAKPGCDARGDLVVAAEDRFDRC